MTQVRLILICGLPGSGKTTHAKQLAPNVQAVRLCPYDWKHDLGIDYYDEQMRVRLEQRLWRLGQELLGVGYRAVLVVANSGLPVSGGFWMRPPTYQRPRYRLRGTTKSPFLRVRRGSLFVSHALGSFDTGPCRPVKQMVPVKITFPVRPDLEIVPTRRWDSRTVSGRRCC
jgi:hypothetical protein